MQHSSRKRNQSRNKKRQKPQACLITDGRGAFNVVYNRAGRSHLKKMARSSINRDTKENARNNRQKRLEGLRRSLAKVQRECRRVLRLFKER